MKMPMTAAMNTPGIKNGSDHRTLSKLASYLTCGAFSRRKLSFIIS
jgi:hypothetical protein